MVFCNKNINTFEETDKFYHNPYFNRWFSAIQTELVKRFYVEHHNPYFNRWFSAI